MGFRLLEAQFGCNVIQCLSIDKFPMDSPLCTHIPLGRPKLLLHITNVLQIGFIGLLEYLCIIRLAPCFVNFADF